MLNLGPQNLGLSGARPPPRPPPPDPHLKPPTYISTLRNVVFRNVKKVKIKLFT